MQPAFTIVGTSLTNKRKTRSTRDSLLIYLAQALTELFRPFQHETSLKKLSSNTTRSSKLSETILSISIAEKELNLLETFSQFACTRIGGKKKKNLQPLSKLKPNERFRCNYPD